MPTDGLRSLQPGRGYGVYDGTNDLQPPVNAEIKDGQWLGVEVQSQGEGGKVIVCAHRYVADNQSRFECEHALTQIRFSL